MSNTYYYEKPYEETATTITTQTQSSPSRGGRPLIIIGLIILGIILLIALFLLLFSKPANTNNNTANNNQKVVLQFRGAFIDKSVIQPLLDEYQALHTNVTIEYADKWPAGTYTDAAAQYRSELNRVLKADESVDIPDIFMIQNSWAGDYDGKYTAPSTNYDYDTFKNTFYPAVVDDFAHDQVVHGVPLWMDTLAVLYNKDMLREKTFTKPLTTWTEFKNQAQLLTKRENGVIKQAGFAAGLTTNTSYPFELSNVLLFQNGVSMLNPTGKVAFSTDSNTAGAINFFKSFAVGSNNTWDSTFQMDAASFLQNKAAMILSTSYRYRDIVGYNKSYNTNIDIGVSQLPQVSGQSQPIINWADYWGAMVALNRPNTSQAWDFLKWLTESDQLKQLSTNVASFTKSFGLLYPRKDMSQLQNTYPELSVFAESIPYAQSWYMIKGIEVKAEFLKLLDKTSANTSDIASTENNIQTIIDGKGKL